jgi:hypothetical protein
VGTDFGTRSEQTKDFESISSGLPHCTITYVANAQNPLSVDVENYTAPVRFFENDRSALYVIGHPIVGEFISAEQVWKATGNTGVPVGFLSKLNGEFLLIHLDKKSKTINVSTDRFSSIPFFYVAEDSGLFGSAFYKDVWAWLIRRNELKLNPAKFFEFLWMQGIVGSKSYETRSSLLTAATTLRFSPAVSGSSSKFTLERYWNPSLEKRELSLDDSAAELAELFRQSMRRKTSDGPGTSGLFLSGGTDSWTVLAAMESDPECYTVGVTDNNEVRVARQAADIAGATHHYVPLEDDPYSRHIDEMILIGGGMHAFDHGIYYGLKEKLQPDPDVLFHGQFLDFWFQGSGMLTTSQNVLGRRTSFKKLVPLSDDITGDYLSQISYRLKGVSLLDYVLEGQRGNMMSSLRESVDEVRDEGESYCLNSFDEWEHLQFYNFSRRYSSSNLTSIGTAAEQRTPVFDNDLFDFYLSLPNSHRLDAKIAMKTLKLLNPELAALPTANTNERPDRGPLGRDFDRAVNFARRKVGIGRSAQLRITPEERTFPDRGRMFAQHPGLKSAAQALCGSEQLASLGFLDMDRLAKDVPRWLENPNKNAGAFITFLVTIDRFLKMTA